MTTHPFIHPENIHLSTAGPGGVWRKGGVQVQLFTETGRIGNLYLNFAEINPVHIVIINPANLSFMTDYKGGISDRGGGGGHHVDA